MIGRRAGVLGWLAARRPAPPLALSCTRRRDRGDLRSRASRCRTHPRPLFRAARRALPIAGRRATQCGGTPGLICSQVVVPLDRTGRVPGTISLHVEVVPAPGTPRGAIFLIAGGPGQGSAHVFGLGRPASVAIYRFLFPGYTLVAYDDRGTGDSGLLDCPAVQAAVTADQQRAAAAACAGTIGPKRDFYSTAEHAEDLDAVRQSLGLRQGRALRRLLRDEAGDGVRARAPRPRRAAAARLGRCRPSFPTRTARTSCATCPRR